MSAAGRGRPPAFPKLRAGAGYLEVEGGAEELGARRAQTSASERGAVSPACSPFRRKWSRRLDSRCPGGDGGPGAKRACEPAGEAGACKRRRCSRRRWRSHALTPCAGGCASGGGSGLHIRPLDVANERPSRGNGRARPADPAALSPEPAPPAPDVELPWLFGLTHEEVVAREARAARWIGAHVVNRALISRRRAGGMPRSDPALYTGLAPVGELHGAGLAKRYRERQLMSVKRSTEPTTTSLRALCEVGFDAMVRKLRAAGLPADDQGTYREARRASILTTVVWRFVCGTVLMAAELGFFETYGPEEETRVKHALSRLREAKCEHGRFMTYQHWYEEDRGRVRSIVDGFCGQRGSRSQLQDFICVGYAPPRLLAPLCRATYRGGQDVTTSPFLHKAMETVSFFWHSGSAEALLAVADAGVSWKDGCCCVQHLPYFGAGMGSQRRPGFHSKELLQDILDMPWIWRGGRAALRDALDFSPSGTGARQGLRTAFGLPANIGIDHDDALALMRRLMPRVLASQEEHAFCSHGVGELQRVEDLHDLQYNLCEIHKLLSVHNSWSWVRRQDENSDEQQVQ